MKNVRPAPAVSGGHGASPADTVGRATGRLCGVTAGGVARGGRVLIAILVGAVFAAACAGAERSAVAVEEIGPGEVTQTVSAPARVDAAARQQVVASASGTVTGIEVEDGSQVEAGQVVVRLEIPQSADPTAPASEFRVEAPFAGTVSIAQSSGGGASASLPPLGRLADGLPQASAPSGGGPLRLGSQVSPGQTLFTVYDLSQMYVIADVDEVDILQIQEGQRAMALIDAIEDSAFPGVVERISIESTTTEAGGTGFPVRIRLDGPAPDLDGVRVGMTSSVEITIRTQESDIVVPSRALLSRGAETVAFVVRDGVAHQVPVEVEILGEDGAAVTGDLREGDAVVVTGSDDLRDGQLVTVR
ncbi:MAG: efflux RND transporter periplasmic adaptor subunit [Egibacteraceae bacterium]